MRRGLRWQPDVKFRFEISGLGKPEVPSRGSDIRLSGHTNKRSKRLTNQWRLPIFSRQILRFHSHETSVKETIRRIEFQSLVLRRLPQIKLGRVIGRGFRICRNPLGYRTHTLSNSRGRGRVLSETPCGNTSNNRRNKAHSTGNFFDHRTCHLTKSNLSKRLRLKDGDASWQDHSGVVLSGYSSFQIHPRCVARA